MKLTNSLTRKVEEIVPITEGEVRLYTCGPTVYDYVTIGNWRTYFLSDILVRTLQYLGYKVKFIMNITDVGHLTGDNLGDASSGEDRQEKAAKREGKSAWDVAKFYTDDFLQGFKKLNMIQPQKFTKATEYIDQQIDLVKSIEKAGFTYAIDDGIYFDTKKYEQAGHQYGQLSTLDQVKEGARVKQNLQKKDPRDFALWKSSPKDEKRQMEWDSPWGVGFPGWHIECSAMIMAELGDQIDIHVGGEDLQSTHHPNEIAQSEAATGKKPFVKHWIHGAFLTVNGGRMGKSLGNAYTLQDLKKKDFDSLDLRYFYFTGNYGKKLNFTWEALQSAKVARQKLVDTVASLKTESQRTTLSPEKMAKLDDYRENFKKSLENDLNLPQALSVVWSVVKSSIPARDKYDLLLDFDHVLGLKLTEAKPVSQSVPQSVQKLVDQRNQARLSGNYELADQLRDQIEEKGYLVKDETDKTIVKQAS